MAENQQSMTLQEALELAIKHHQAGQLDTAKSIYQQILHAQPQQPIALHLLGVISHQNGDNSLAVDLISKAITLEPQYAEAHSNLSLALSALGKTHDAIDSCKKALAINPEYAEAHNNLGLALESLAKLNDSEHCYRTAINLKPTYAIAHNNLGNVLQDLGKLGAAIESYKKAIEEDPQYADAHNNMGNALRAEGRLEDALECYRKSLDINKNSTHARSNLGDTLKDLAYQKRFSEKNDSSGDQLKVAPKLSQDQSETWTEILAVAESTLQLKPNDTSGLALKTSALIGLHKLDEWESLCNFERFIETVHIEVPNGYKNLKAFNESLFKRCSEDPNLSYEQGGKAIKKGKRLNALQLDPPDSPVSLLLDRAKNAIHDYTLGHPPDKNHPYLAQIPTKWRLTAWGSILYDQGHHETHIHPSGWISGVYYGILPTCTKDGDDQGEGYIEFGRPSNHVATQQDPNFHLLQPSEGQIVLFPSYFYHQTIPFKSHETRFTIAFDVIPESW